MVFLHHQTSLQSLSGKVRLKRGCSEAVMEPASLCASWSMWHVGCFDSALGLLDSSAIKVQSQSSVSLWFSVGFQTFFALFMYQNPTICSACLPNIIPSIVWSLCIVLSCCCPLCMSYPPTSSSKKAIVQCIAFTQWGLSLTQHLGCFFFFLLNNTQ